MNELQLLADLYDDPPAPSANAMATARLRMTDPDAAAGPARRRLRPQPRRRSPRRTLPRPGLRLGLGLGVLAAGTAAAVAVTAIPGGAHRDAPDRSPSAVPTVLSARTVLLAAAVKIEHSPSSGAYWYTKAIVGDQALVKDKGYLVERKFERESWIPTSDKEYHWVVEQYLGGKPATPADEAAWRRDGSPAAWRIFEVDGTIDSRPRSQSEMLSGDQDGIPVRAAAGERYAVPKSLRPGWKGNLAEEEITPAQLRRLPTDPAKLRTYLTKRLTADHVPSGGEALTTALFWEATQLLISMPTTPAVRAATYRMLADFPGVITIGAVRDYLGRTGQAVAVHDDRGPDGSATVEHRLVIDPKSGTPLALESTILEPFPHFFRSLNEKEKVGQLYSFTEIVDARWTDTAPVLPKKRYSVDMNGNPLKPGCARC